MPNPTVADFSWTTWHGDGTLRAGLLLLAGLYVLGVGPIRRRWRLAPRVGRGQVATFLAGVAVLFVALDGPLHELSDFYLFSAHMVQHMLLTLFAPPLLLLGTPGWLLRPLVRQPVIGRVARVLTAPLPALLLFNAVFILSHFPVFYQLTLTNHSVHIAEHLLFMATAVITWWPLFSPLAELPRLPYPLQLLYIGGQTFSGFLVGAFLTNSPRVLYPFYAAAPRVWGISAIEDQRLGGLLMWIGGGIYLLLLFSLVFFLWARHEQVGDDVAQPLAPPTPRTAAAARPPAQPPTLVARAARGRPSAAPLPRGLALGAEHVVGTEPDKARRN